MPEEESPNLKEFDPVTKSAILLMSIGSEDASEVLKHMGPKEVAKLGGAMANLKNVPKNDVQQVVAEFLGQVSSETSIGVGSEGYIRDTLMNALGQDKASGLLDRIFMGENSAGLDTLKWMEPQAILEVIRMEHPQIQSIVIAYLDSDQAAAVLSELDERQRTDIMMRISSLKSVQPAALRELNDILEAQFSSSGSTSSAVMGGSKVAADIMNFLDTAIESQVMDGIRDMDDELAEEIEELMFVFDNLGEVDDRAIQAILREISSDALILALKGADDIVAEKVFTNMSKRAAELLKDDLEAKGPVKLSEVEAAQKEILSTARRMADSGEIVLGGKGGEEMI